MPGYYTERLAAERLKTRYRFYAQHGEKRSSQQVCAVYSPLRSGRRLGQNAVLYAHERRELNLLSQTPLRIGEYPPMEARPQETAEPRTQRFASEGIPADYSSALAKQGAKGRENWGRRTQPFEPATCKSEITMIIVRLALPT
jgi:hypothetical protein